MAKWIRNKYDEILSYESLMRAHKLSCKGKKLRREVILFSLKEEEYIKYLYEKLKSGTYVHGKYSAFKVYEPKERFIEKAPYIDRIVHRWIVDNFLAPYYVPSFIKTTYACIKDRRNAQCNIRFAIRNAKNEKGIEIGNYTSQTFANIYLNELDQYATRKLKVPFYYRYMDDIVILFKTKKDAKEALDKIKKFLKEHLELELNDKTNIFRGKQGVNFCGYKINENSMKVRDKGKKKFKKKVKKLLREIKNENLSSKDARIYLTGHLGYFNIANTYTLKKKNILLQDELLREKIIY